MDGYTFHSHTLYLEKATGRHLLAVHHNPMALRSLLYQAKNEDAAFSWTKPVPVSAETLIQLRQSNGYQELEPFSDTDFLDLLDHMLTAHALSGEDGAYLEAMRKELREKKS